MSAYDAGGDVFGGASAGSAFGLSGAAAGGALGLGKYFLIDDPAYQRKLALTAATQRYAPWTGFHAQAPEQPDPFSNALAFGSQGAAFGQNLAANKAQAAMQAAQLKNLDAQTNYYTSRAPGLNFGTEAPVGSYGKFYGDYINSLDGQYESHV